MFRVDLLCLTVRNVIFIFSEKRTKPISSKSTAVPAHVRKTRRGNRGMSPLILNLCTRCWWVVNLHTLVHKQHNSELPQVSELLQTDWQFQRKKRGSGQVECLQTLDTRQSTNIRYHLVTTFKLECHYEERYAYKMVNWRDLLPGPKAPIALFSFIRTQY